MALPAFHTSQFARASVRDGGRREEPREEPDWERLHSVARDNGHGFSRQLPQDSPSVSHTRPATVMASEVGQSVRFGKSDHQNVTHRDSKRPKERSRDQAYKKRFSMCSSAPSYDSPSGTSYPVGGPRWPREMGYSSPSPSPVFVMGQESSSFRAISPTRSVTPSGPVRKGAKIPSEESTYEITLIHEGMTVC
jgi:hypothetical protein